jgi:Transposase IS66 family
MQVQAEAQLADPKLPTPCRNVLVSLLEHWDGLTRFVDDPRIPLDNNASERQVRGPALGRKNYYGSGALWSGRLTAMLFSLFATLNLSQINIRKWLTWFLQSCAQNAGQAPAVIDPFLPWKMSEEKRRELALDSKRHVLITAFDNPFHPTGRRSQIRRKSNCAHSEAERFRRSLTVENLNSRLRTYFFLQRQLGTDYLTLLQFFLNHRRYLRSEHPGRIGKSPAELLTGEPHAHWLELLGYTRFARS